MPIGAIWRTFLETPLVNVMVGLTNIAFGDYGLALLLFTFLSRALLFPLTVRMLNSMKKLQEIQPRMQEIQKKYSDPKRRQEETMKLYREAGVNPLGCLGPQLIQFPIFIALYQVIRITLGSTPESVVALSDRLYNVGWLQNSIPLSRDFLWLDLGENGDFALAALVFCSMWLQQRISSNRNLASRSDNQQQMNTMMQWMFPLMFTWFVLATPAGLGLYWGSSTLIGIVLQWIFVGPGDFRWGSLIPDLIRRQIGMKDFIPPSAESIGKERIVSQDNEEASSEKESTSDESEGSGQPAGDGKRKKRRGRDRTGPGGSRDQSGSGRRRRRKRR